MISKTTRQFRNLMSKLPKDVQRQAKQAYEMFRDNASHPSLRFKTVHTSASVYSARINIDYLALATVDGELAIWFWIGSHSEYDKLLEKL